MRIAYIVHWDLSRESGVLKKIVSQMRAWIHQGQEARLFALSPSAKIWEGMDGLPVDLVLRGKTLTLFFKAEILVRRVMTWKPDLVYLRFSTYYPSLEALMTVIPTFLELNTDDISESKLTYPKYKYLYHRLTRERILRKAYGMIPVTHEIADKFSRYQKPMLVVANGVDLSQYPPLPAPKNPSPRLIFVGTPGHLWHGIDKILWLATRFTGWHFDLIGVEPKEAALYGGLSSNVRAHGLQNHTQYREILAGADVAIGTLSLHRTGMNEASPLKVREYLACGIPTVIGYRDTDFPQPVPYLLQLPNTPDNVVKHASTIEQFVEAWRGKRVPRSELAHLSVGFKEKEKVLFFRKVLGRAA